MQAEHNANHHAHDDDDDDDREPFEIFVDTMSEVVRSHVGGGNRGTLGKIDEEYISIVESEQRRKGTIDLRTEQEKRQIEDWKKWQIKKTLKKKKKSSHDSGHDSHGGSHGGSHGDSH
jgi:hypothetical protein